MVKFCEAIKDKSKKDTREYYQDKRTWVFEVGSALLFAVIVPIIEFALGIITNILIGILSGVGAGLVVLVLWCVGTRIYFRLTAPAKLYYEKVKEINELRTKLYNKSKIEGDFYSPKSLNGEKWLNIRITNNTGTELISCYTYPISIFDINNLDNNLYPRSPKEDKYFWRDHKRDDKNIRNGGEELVPLGRINYKDNRLLIEMQNSKDIILSGTYIITIGLSYGYESHRQEKKFSTKFTIFNNGNLEVLYDDKKTNKQKMKPSLKRTS